jgi:hypothetical protein
MKAWYSPLILLVLALIGCSKEPVKENFLLQKISSEKTGIDFKNQLTEDADHSIINYIYYYNGGGIASGDINNDGLIDLYFVSNNGSNKLYLNKGNLRFEDISSKANIEGNSSWNTGATMVDVNNDGFLDIYLCSVSGLLDFKGHNELFINNGDGTFTEKAKEYGLDFKGYSTQSYFFDYDKDDDLDVYIVNHAVHTTVSHGPADSRNKRAPLVGDVLLKNVGGKFIDASKEANIFGGANGYGLSASIADYNNDGWDDIYVCNDFHEDDYYYINNQDGTFTEDLTNTFSTISRFSMGSDAADLNGDGYQDIVTLDMLPKNEKVIKESEGDDAMFNLQERLRKLGYKDQYSRNMLQINNGGKYFHETAFFNSIADTDWSWAPLIADFNNDGHQDIFVTNGILRRPNDLDFKKYVASTFKDKGTKKGMAWLYRSINEMPQGKVANQMFKGDSKRLVNTTGEWIENTPSLSNGAIYLDLDADGDLDIVTNNLNSTASIYENTSNKKKNHISLQFNYKKGNKEGISTKAIVFTKNKKQLRQLFKSRGFISSVSNTLHFGLDTINTIDSIQVIWPDLVTQTVVNPKVNQHLTIKYNSNNPTYKYNQTPTNTPYFKETKLIDYTHIEDSYNDFNNERLIPYKVSTLGPALAIKDIDNNGYDDIFIGGASGKKAKLYLNTGKDFALKNIPEIENDYLSEDNAAVFFDADGDGDMDLYVASGISFLRRKKHETDRLYINNHGKFEKTTDQIPVNNLNTSCVTAYDYDGDGDTDLFVGNLSNPNDFGSNVASYILVNNGKGYFSKNSDFKLFSKVTSATWQDLNNDNQKDLLISTEWDTPRIYLNNHGKLTLVEIPDHMNGLWQTITSYDIDNDGDNDVLLGNWGQNTKLNSSPKKPILMYHNDFDVNGKFETVVARQINDHYYPINSKDELASQMIVLNKRFVKYKDFALQPVEFVLGTHGIENATKYKVHRLASGYLQNTQGKFTEFIEFEEDFQLAPINSFSHLTINSKKQLLVSGNSLKVSTYHGAYRAMKGLFVRTNKDYEAVANYGISPFHNQVKSTAIVKMEDKDLLLILNNNDSLKTYLSKKSK